MKIEKKGRIRSIAPRTSNYEPRASIIVTESGATITETGEYITFEDLPEWAWKTLTPYMFVFPDVVTAYTLNALLTETFGHDPAFKLTYVSLVHPEGHEAAPIPKGMSFSNRTKGGQVISVGGRKKTANHRYFIYELAVNPAKYERAPSGEELLSFWKRWNTWHQQANLPISESLASVGSKLLRDPRFWPEWRGRVPRATNEALRSELLGVQNIHYGDTHVRYETATIWDQRRAYHKAALTMDVPNPNELFAHGDFKDPYSKNITAAVGTPLYRTVRESTIGSVYVLASSRPCRSGEFRPPSWGFHGRKRLHLWTNEFELAEKHLIIHGIIAHRTSPTADEGLKRYAKWALNQLESASPEDIQWLKPALHSVYGLMGSRVSKRSLYVTQLGGSRRLRVPFSHEPVPTLRAQFVGEHPCTNVCTLGLLQAEQRLRSLRKAEELHDRGWTILHIAADGLHAIPPEFEPLHVVDSDWTEESVQNLFYLDKQSWGSTAGWTLPGRSESWRTKNLPDLIAQFKLAGSEKKSPKSRAA